VVAAKILQEPQLRLRAQNHLQLIREYYYNEEYDAMAEKVRKLNKLVREPGYRYFLDKDGDISRIPMATGEKKTGKKKAKKTAK
jgi:hypothetical protein